MLKVQVDPKGIFRQAGRHLTLRPQCLCKGNVLCYFTYFPLVWYKWNRSTSCGCISVALKVVELDWHSAGPKHRIPAPEVASHSLSLYLGQVCSVAPMLLGSLQSLFINLLILRSHVMPLKICFWRTEDFMRWICSMVWRWKEYRRSGYVDGLTLANILHKIFWINNKSNKNAIHFKQQA